MTTETMKPILVMDLRKTDRARIQHVLSGIGFDCSDEQAEQLRGLCAHVMQSDDDFEIRAELMRYVEVDWSKAPEARENVMQELASEYREAVHDHHDNRRRKIEQQMLIVTNGMDEHPEWWTWPCVCDECRSSV